jgi:hypothetical protein
MKTHLETALPPGPGIGVGRGPLLPSASAWEILVSNMNSPVRVCTDGCNENATFTISMANFGVEYKLTRSLPHCQPRYLG